MRSCLSIFLILLTIGLVFIGLDLLIPGIRVLNRLDITSTLIDQCTIPGQKATLRLYLGNGGATTSFYYRVTIQEGFFSNEYLFYTVYGLPEIKSIECQSDSIIIRQHDANNEEVTISYAEIRNRLIDRPLYFEYSSPVKVEQDDSEAKDQQG